MHLNRQVQSIQYSSFCLYTVPKTLQLFKYVSFPSNCELLNAWFFFFFLIFLNHGYLSNLKLLKLLSGSREKGVQDGGGEGHGAHLLPQKH